ncbi:MAG: MMPL family transporter [Clostridia bacterium]|nr:MMPL family transporter [Clostridia bacterium]
MARMIVKYRYWLLALFFLLAVFSLFSIRKTKINYDLNRYLSDETMTKRALLVMQEEFGSSEQLRVMFVDGEEQEIIAYTSQINAMPEVLFASYDPETGFLEADGNTYSLVSVTLNGGDAAETVKKLRSMFPAQYYVGGSAATQLDIQKSVGEEIPLVMFIAVGIVLLVLLATSHAWAEPIVLLIVLSFSILINMGTNFVFPDVSFITFAVCAILQLALSIDYAIMLLHTYNGYREAGRSAADAMREALSECFMRIASSAFTTVAGLLSLLFMSFTIGFDIGLVLSKGIVISMVCVFFMMPGVTILLEKPLLRTRHRHLRLGGDRLAAGIDKAKRPLACVLVLAVLCGLYLNSRNTYSFTSPEAAAKSESALISSRFGTSNPLVFLVPGGEEDADFDRQRDLASRLQAVTMKDGQPAVGEISAMVTTGAQALKYYTPKEVAELTGQSAAAVNLFFMMRGFGASVRADRLLDAASAFAAGNGAIRDLQAQLAAARSAFIGPHFARMAAELRFSTTDADFTEYMDAILKAASQVYGADYYITGVPMSTYDIGEAFHSDLLKVNFITLFAILLIVMISFRSFGLPLILVFVIEGAIWITMGFSYLISEPIFFISYLICVSIQMGATIDYGILLSDQYRSLRLKGLKAREAAQEALKKALPTVLTSGIIIIVAGYIIGKQCSIYYISSIGLLVSRGALVSVLLVLSLLPSLLLLADKYIIPKRT